jgi:hypothetical protein
MSDVKPLMPPVDVVQAQLDDLAPTQTIDRQQHRHSEVTASKDGPSINRGKHALDLFRPQKPRALVLLIDSWRDDYRRQID